MYITTRLSSSSPQFCIQGNLEDKTGHFLKVTSPWWRQQDCEFSETHPPLLSLPFADTKLTLFAHFPWMLHPYAHRHSTLKKTTTTRWAKAGCRMPAHRFNSHSCTGETTHFSRRGRSTSAVGLYYTSRYTETHSAGHNMSVTNTTRILFPVILVLLTNEYI